MTTTPTKSEDSRLESPSRMATMLDRLKFHYTMRIIGPDEVRFPIVVTSDHTVRLVYHIAPITGVTSAGALTDVMYKFLAEITPAQMMHAREQDGIIHFPWMTFRPVQIGRVESYQSIILHSPLPGLQEAGFREGRISLPMHRPNVLCQVAFFFYPNEAALHDQLGNPSPSMPLKDLVPST